MKSCLLLIAAVFVFQSCARSNPSLPADPGAQQPPPAEAPSAPGAPENPGTGEPESGNYFSNIDKEIPAAATGDRFVSERFYTVMAKLSVYAMICDFKNEKGWSAQVSKLWNSSTALQKVAEKVYGGEKPAYNRFEKQRNIESNRLSFQSGPTPCPLAEASFNDYAALTAAQLATTLRTTPRGTL